jgi:hypothetical protein
LQEVTLEFPADAYRYSGWQAEGAGRLAEARRAFLRFNSESPTSGSAERRGVRVPSSPRSEYADVTDMFRRVMTVHEQSIEYKCQRDVIIERCLPLADHIPHRFRTAANRSKTSFK